LDPNAANTIRVQTLKMLLDVSAALDTPLGQTNKLISADQRFNQQRRQDLLTRMDSLYSDLDRVTGELAVLKVERERLNKENADDATKNLKQAEVDAATARQDIINQRLKATSDEIKGLTSASGTLAGPNLSENNSRVPDAIADQLLKDKDLIHGDARLSASTMLDNHIQMQYELIAKQLTLLRDEVAPGERLVFLELPASFYTTPGKAEEILAQVWWRIDGFRRTDEFERGIFDLDVLRKDTRNLYDTNRLTRLQWIDAQTRMDLAEADVRNKELERKDLDRQRILQGGAQTMPTPPVIADNPPPSPVTAYYTEKPYEYYTPLEAMDQRWRHAVRTVDLIPRQSSLNVNDIQDTVKAGRISAAFSFLFGFGAKVDFQRQRELYEEYLHQEIFASGFGKGEQTFGWTYGPTPGTKRIAPGLRTSYAVLIVPDTATMLHMTAKACYFPRKAYAPDDFRQVTSNDWFNGLEKRCTGDNNQIFDVPIPGTRDNNFWLTEVRYKPVAPGQRTVVFLHGDNISAQTGVLVNGTPLRPAVGVAQPDLNDPKLEEDLLSSGENAVSGYYELVNRSQMALVFKMPKDFKGTPVITLVSPGRGRNINAIPLRINSGDIKPLNDAEAMFADDVPAPVFSISNLEILTMTPQVNAYQIVANLSGTLFDEKPDQLVVNGRPMLHTDFLSKGLFRLTFLLQPEDQVLNFTIKQGDKVAQKSFSKPVTLKVDKFDILNFQPPDKKTKGAVTIRLQGVGFGSGLTVSVNGVAVPQNQFIVISETEAVLVVKQPDETLLITVNNPATGGSTSVLVVRPTSSKEPASTERKP